MLSNPRNAIPDRMKHTIERLIAYSVILGIGIGLLIGYFIWGL